MPALIFNNTADGLTRCLPIPSYSEQETTNRMPLVSMAGFGTWKADKTGYVNVCIQAKGRDGKETLECRILVDNNEVVRVSGPAFLLVQRTIALRKGQTVQVRQRILAPPGAFTNGLSGFCYYIPPLKRW